MSQCLVPNWNLKQQRQQQVEGEEGISRRSSHVHSDWHSHPDPAATHLVPMYAPVHTLAYKIFLIFWNPFYLISSACCFDSLDDVSIFFGTLMMLV